MIDKNPKIYMVFNKKKGDSKYMKNDNQNNSAALLSHEFIFLTFFWVVISCFEGTVDIKRCYMLAHFPYYILIPVMILP